MDYIQNGFPICEVMSIMRADSRQLITIFKSLF